MWASEVRSCVFLRLSEAGYPACISRSYACAVMTLHGAVCQLQVAIAVLAEVPASLLWQLVNQQRTRRQVCSQEGFLKTPGIEDADIPRSPRESLNDKIA